MRKKTAKNRITAACLALLLGQAALFLPVFSGCAAGEPDAAAEEIQDAAAEETQNTPREKRERLACLYADPMREEAFARQAEPDARCADACAVLLPHYGNALYLACNALSGIEREIDLVVLVGPNHSGHGDAVQISGADWYWETGGMTGDAETAKSIAGYTGAALTDQEIAQDWSVQTLVPYACRYFPSAQVVTVLLSRGADKASLSGLAQILAEIAQDREVLLIASADFSHYLTPAEAERCDARTIELIEAGETGALLTLDNGYIDSPETLVTAMLFARSRERKLIRLDGLFEIFWENGVQKAGSYYAFADMETEQ